MHPYPRKMVSPVKTGIMIPKKPNMMSLENQSPTSVLSIVGSDLSGGHDSCIIPNGSSSSFSSDPALIPGNVFSSDENSCTDEDIPLVLALSF